MASRKSYLISTKKKLIFLKKVFFFSIHVVVCNAVWERRDSYTFMALIDVAADQHIV